MSIKTFLTQREQREPRFGVNLTGDPAQAAAWAAAMAALAKALKANNGFKKDVLISLSREHPILDKLRLHIAGGFCSLPEASKAAPALLASALVVTLGSLKRAATLSYPSLEEAGEVIKNMSYIIEVSNEFVEKFRKLTQ